MRVAAREGGVAAELDPRQRVPNRAFRGGACTMGAQDVQDRGADAQRGIERAARVLGDVGDDLPAQVANRAGVSSEDAVAADVDAAALEADPGAGVAEERKRDR